MKVEQKADETAVMLVASKDIPRAVSLVGVKGEHLVAQMDGIWADMRVD